MALNVIRMEIDGGVATVYLHRPGRGNSWTTQMNVEYRQAMADLDADGDVRAIVVRGTGKQFCVGADFDALDHYMDGKADYVSSVSDADMAKPGHGVRPEFDHDMVWHWGLRKPVIAAVNGACAGVAMALVAFSDFRYGMAGAKLTTAAPRLGLPAEYGLSWLLPRLVGVTRAADILMTGRVFLAEEAAEIGFFNAVYGEEAFFERVYETARYMAEQVSPAAFVSTKRQLYTELMQQDVGAAVETSKHLIGEHMRSADYREGVRAFLEKRPPKFEPLT